MLLVGFVLPPHARQFGTEVLTVLGLESDDREGRAVASEPDCPSDPGVGTGGDSFGPFTAVCDLMRETRSSSFSSR